MPLVSRTVSREPTQLPSTRSARPFLASDAALLVVGAAFGVALAALDLRPTGAVASSVAVLVVGCAFGVWAGARAPWWTVAAAGAVAGALGASWVAVLLGVLVALDAVVLFILRATTPMTNGVLVGGTMVAFAGAREVGGWGGNAVVSIGVVAALAVVGLVRRPEHRRRVALAAAGVGLAALVVVGVAALVAQSARDDLTAGNRAARAGLRDLEAGEFERAQGRFASAAEAFDRAADRLGSPLVQPARVIPIASQHVTAGSRLSTAAFDAARAVEDELRSIDVEALRIADGRIDVDAVRELSGSMHRLQAAVDDLDGAIADSRNGWLVDPVSRVLEDLTDDLDRQRERGERVIAALDVAPQMLGAEGERVYLVMFTTPAEARGQGGFMGNWAELSIDDGEIAMTEYGNDEELNEAGPRPRRLEQAPDDWVARYGQFGFVDADGEVGEVPWKNITMSPNFPATARVAAELYPQSGGRPVDGVFNLDVYALEALIGLVGPIEVEGAPRPLNGRNAAEFLLFEQYLTDDQDARGDMLDAVTVAAVDRLLHTSPPEPLDLGKTMAPLVDERRVMAWSAHPAEQQLFETLGLDGALRSQAEHMVSVALVNAGGSKIDAFLEHDVAVVETADGPVLELALTNHAPADGLPDFIIGNVVGLPTGTTRLWVTGFASVPITDATADGEPLDVGFGREADLAAVSAFVELGPGASTTVVFDLDAPEVAADEFDVVRPPLVREPADPNDR